MTREQAEKKDFNQSFYYQVCKMYLSDPNRAHDAGYQVQVGELLRVAMSSGTYHPKVYA